MKVFLGIVIALFIGLQIQAQLRLPRFFSDHMVIQRDKPVVVWGWATPDQAVSVAFRDQRVEVKADAQGHWRASLKSFPAGGPYEMQIEAGEQQISLKDILVGDVWLCSGQSNMEFALKDAYGADTTIRKAVYPDIRLLTIPKIIRNTPQEDIPGEGWQECSPASVPDFSAVGYFFGKYLQAEIQVPVGLIHTSWGGTDIRTWMSWKAVTALEELEDYQGKMPEDLVRDIREGQEVFFRALQNDPGLRDEWYTLRGQTEGWNETDVPWKDGNILDEEDGIVWFRKTVILPEGMGGKAGELCLGPVDDEDMTYINGVCVGGMNDWNSARSYSVPAGILKAGENEIAVRCKDNNGGGGLTGRPEQYGLIIEGERYDLSGRWLYKPSVLNSMFQYRSIADCNIPSVLHQGMVNPLVGYPIKGVIWYQGESNDWEAHYYRELFPRLIRDWRALWGNDFPFIWVQLANYKAVKAEPGESAWAELREAQNRTLLLPGTGQAVITDIGDDWDIHPKNKREVGYRLYRNALQTAYHRKMIGHGPVFQSMKVKGNRIVLKFKDTGEGLVTTDGADLNGFAIAGKDRHFVRAKAAIRGNRVIVYCDSVEQPVAVRYGWADNPKEANLTNSEGLLASPFRTDDWKGITK